jgi:uncharacterized ion transporter superfamily protein YfcC
MKKFKFPSAHTVLLIIAAFVAIATQFIPAGKYEQLKYVAAEKKGEEGSFVHLSKEGEKSYPGTQATLDSFGIATELEKFSSGGIWKPVGIPGTYYELEESNPQGILAFIKSPLKGIMEAMDVILFVLILGGFIGIVHHTGAFDAGVGALGRSLEGKEKLLIIIITSLIALGGTTFGLAEETIAFYPILVPIFLAARYDAIVALACIYIGSSVGTMVSTVNPFSAIIASNAAGINWTEGLLGRILMLLLCTGICIWYIIRYAEKVRKDPTKSLIYSQRDEINKMFATDLEKVTAFTPRIRATLIIFAASFIIMIIGVSKLGWWFMEMTMIFLVAALVVGFIAGIKEKIFIENFVKGANDLLNVALIIGIARGIGWLMDEGAISDTLLYNASTAIEGMPKGLFANVMLFLYAGLSFFIPSSSGLAVLSMPIMAPLGDVVDVPREIIVNAYQYGMGLMAFITPTGLILASLTMVNVTYDKWLKFVMPLLIALTIVSMIVLTVQVYL